MTRRKKIAIDIDDVLSRTAEGFIAFSNQRWGLSLKPEDYQEEWAVVWGVPVEDALKRSIEFHATGVVGSFEPNEAALPVLKRLAKQYELVTVTSRRSIIKPETDAWIERHFPGIFSELHYAGIWDKTDHTDVHQRLKHTKAELLSEIGADFLIDDLLKHCRGAAKAGIPAILFAAPHKGGWDGSALPAGITYARHWEEVAEYFHV
jgi:5'(3')-deoxyribonucleotidase